MRKQKPIVQLMLAADRYAEQCGDANWTQGYRTRREGIERLHNGPEADRLRRSEIEQFDDAVRSRIAFRRLALKLLREARQSKGPGRAARRTGR